MTNGIDKIIDKYYSGESSAHEEKLLRQYLLSENVDDNHQHLVPIFQYFEEERNMSISFEPDLSFTKTKATKFRFLMPKIIGIAASLLILISVGFNWFNTNDTIYKNKYTQLEDPEEALAITLDALGFVGNKFEKGTSSLASFKKLEKTAISKHNR